MTYIPDTPNRPRVKGTSSSKFPLAILVSYLHTFALHGKVLHVVASVKLEEAGDVPEEGEQDHGQDVEQA